MGFGKRVRKVRGGLTQDGYAKKLNVSVTAVQNWELKDQIPKGDILLKIKKEFDTDMNWLLTGKGGDPDPYSKNLNESIVFDPAVQILREIGQETGYTLTHEQRRSVIKVLKNELQRTKQDIKNEITGLIKSFKNSDESL